MSTTPQPSDVRASKPSLNLHLDVEEVKGELNLTAPSAIQAVPEADRELDEQAAKYADALTELNPENFDAREQLKSTVEEMGRALQQESSKRSRMLQRPVKELSEHGAEGGPVANSLVELKMQVEEMDPARVDFEAGWFSRLLGMIPGVGGPVKRYFSKFESSQTVIDAIIRSLELGKDQLRRDNITLSEDQRIMRALTMKLERQIKLGQLLDQKLQYKLDREIGPDDPRSKFVQEELLFPLRQRIMDLQQQLAVNQQGVITTEIVKRNNLELSRGVDRALNVTVSALNVAVSVALALNNQRIVLDKVSALNTTTSNLIAGTAERLKTQGAAIHTQASSAMLDVNALKSAFADINTAMSEIYRFRQQALPKMAQTILEFNKLTEAGEEAVKRLEKGAQAAPSLELNSS